MALAGYSTGAFGPVPVAVLVRVTGVPALPSRAAWRELTRQAPPAVLAHLLGTSPAMRR